MVPIMVHQSLEYIDKNTINQLNRPFLENVLYKILVTNYVF